MKRKLLLLIFTLSSLGLWSQDSVLISRQSQETIEEKPQKKMSWLRRTIRGFSYVDTNYVEPQHYNWSVMMQGTYNYDFYRLSSVGDNKQSISFAPTASWRIGPYFGWRWVFLGYTFDLKHFEFRNKSLKQEINFSFYSAQIGVDLYYRRTGSDYLIRNVKLGNGIDTGSLEDVPFDGISVGITGINVYYIFNHKRFSYPAAFNQSTCQKISCGSWLAGIGYTRNSIEFDHEKLQQLLNERLPGKRVDLDQGLMFNSVDYFDISFSGGYAYNWVFAKNWLFGASLSAAVAYKKTQSGSDEEGKGFSIKNFNISNFNIDGVGRFGLVYNNTRWYAGASAIVRAYNYKKENFAANNIFGNLNIYVGYNFGARSHYKKKKH